MGAANTRITSGRKGRNGISSKGRGCAPDSAGGKLEGAGVTA